MWAIAAIIVISLGATGAALALWVNHQERTKKVYGSLTKANRKSSGLQGWCIHGKLFVMTDEHGLRMVVDHDGNGINCAEPGNLPGRYF